MLLVNFPVSIIPNKLQQWLLFILVVSCASLLYFYGTGLTPYYPLTWLAPVPVLWYMLSVKSRAPLVAGFLSYFFGSLNMFDYLSIHVPHVVIILTLVFQALVFTFGLWLFSWGMNKNKFFGLLLLPSYWLGYECALASFSPHGTFGSLAYTQVDFIPFIQMASITGIWGVVFCLLLVPTLIAMVLKEGRVYWLCLLFCVCVVLVPSWDMLGDANQDQLNLKVGMIAADSLLTDFNSVDSASANKVLSNYLSVADSLVKSGIDVLVLPEKIITITDEYEADIKQKLLEYTSKNKILLVIGATLEIKNTKNNIAWVFDEGRLIGQYNKQHLVPGWESAYEKGEQLLTFSKWGKKIGVAICKDMDFPALSQAYEEQGVDLMLVPAWDFVKDAQLHNNMARMRAIENRFAVVRVASEGLLAIINPDGQNHFYQESFAGIKGVIGELLLPR